MNVSFKYLKSIHKIELSKRKKDINDKKSMLKNFSWLAMLKSDK